MYLFCVNDPLNSRTTDQTVNMKESLLKKKQSLGKTSPFSRTMIPSKAEAKTCLNPKLWSKSIIQQT